MFDHRKFEQLREAQDLTLFGVAAELHHNGHPRSVPTVRSWAEGRIQPRVDDLVAVAGVLGVSPEELIVMSENDDAETPPS
jgi:transcriptional regulator with XRE-family HTH domain